MDGLFFFVVFAAIVFAIVHAAKQRGKANDVWKSVARDLGLKLSPGSLVAQPELRGEIDGFPVTVDTVSRGSGKSNQTFTRYRVTYPKIGVKLRLTREVPLVSTIGKMFGGQDIEVGDAEFDDRVVVRAPGEAPAKQFLTAPRRRAIERFLTSHRNAVITESSATFETAGLETRAAGLERGVRLLVDLARELAVPEGATAPRRGAAPRPRAAAAAGIAAALGTLAAATPAAASNDEDEKDDWTLPTSPAETPEPPPPDPPRRAEPGPPVAEPPSPPLPGSVTPPARIEIGSAPPMPEVAPVDPDAPSANAAEEDVMPSGRQQEVCAALFSEDSGLSRARDVFEADYANLFVHWKGELRSARHYYSDLVFGSEPGTRAEVMVAKVKSGILGEREIIAVVQLPVAAEREIAPRVGDHVTFEGDLASVDPFMRQVFVRNARIVG